MRKICFFLLCGLFCFPCYSQTTQKTVENIDGWKVSDTYYFYLDSVGNKVKHGSEVLYFNRPRVKQSAGLPAGAATVTIPWKNGQVIGKVQKNAQIYNCWQDYNYGTRSYVYREQLNKARSGPEYFTGNGAKMAQVRYLEGPRWLITGQWQFLNAEYPQRYDGLFQGTADANGYCTGTIYATDAAGIRTVVAKFDDEHRIIKYGDLTYTYDGTEQLNEYLWFDCVRIYCGQDYIAIYAAGPYYKASQPVK